MAQPSSSHHRERGERERDHSHRSERSAHHHHRTISSTTLLLVLSLILAVLAVMLSLPSQNSSANPADPQATGVWNYLTPKRSGALIARESNVAQREAEVARREAEILAGAPGGVIGAPPTPCPPCPMVAQATFEPPPAQTVIKEVVKEDAITPPGWWKEGNVRFDDILDRELKIAEREREISRREETVNRREHDASRREAWIMEQLVALGNEPEVEEEYHYEPLGAPRAPVPPPKRRPNKELPPVIITEIEAVTRTITQVQIETATLPNETVTIPPPANTRRAASPTPSPYTSSSTSTLPRTTSIEVLVEEHEEIVHEEPIEEEEEEEYYPEPVPRRKAPARRVPPPPPPPAAYRPQQRWGDGGFGGCKSQHLRWCSVFTMAGVASEKSPFPDAVPAPSTSYSSPPSGRAGFSALSPLTSVYQRFQNWRSSLGLPNPGSVENLGKEVKNTHLTNYMFDGARADLMKNLSMDPAFQVTHSFSLASQTAPPTYSFGALFMTQSIFLQGNVDHEGNVSARVNHGWSPTNVTKMQAQLSQQVGHNMVQLEQDYQGLDYSVNAKAINPSPIDGSGIFVGSYFQSITKNLALGLESVYQRQQDMSDLSVSYLGKYTGANKDWVATATVQPIGCWTLLASQRGG
ncbi:hypothetical protein EWM64_g9290 [Hericium alpestre]|uniref:Uncharacterized protein n=1 Tax=Hericium alpestre TaxID=135208 RepID=A0A4Y9ZL91_9AGAM|nr:hypothetical protein EWM64_g9290 [Hericium alpestre]